MLLVTPHYLQNRKPNMTAYLSGVLYNVTHHAKYKDAIMEGLFLPIPQMFAGVGNPDMSTGDFICHDEGWCVEVLGQRVLIGTYYKTTTNPHTGKLVCNEKRRGRKMTALYAQLILEQYVRKQVIQQATYLALQHLLQSKVT